MPRKRDKYTQAVLNAQANEASYLAEALRVNNGALVDALNSCELWHVEDEDFASMLKVAMIDAVRRYKESKGLWGPYLYKRLQCEIRSIMRYYKHKDRGTGLNVTHSTDAVEWDHNGKCESRCVDMDLRFLMSKLSVKDQAALELHYLHRFTLRHISKVWGIKFRAAQYMLNRAKARARAHLK